MFRSRLTLFLLLLLVVSCKDQNKTESTEVAKPIVNESIAQQTKIEEAPKNSSAKKSKITIRTVRKEEISEASNFLLFDKAPQSYTIDQDRDTTLYCIEGTKIKIQKRSFVFDDNNNEPSQVTINIKEYYKTDDIIFADLSTRSGDSILETGGMIFLEVVSEKRKCKLKEDSQFEISFPYETRKEDMQLFTGAFKDGKIDWISQSSGVPGRESVVEAAEFPGGPNMWVQLLNRYLVYPDSLADVGTFKLIVRFCIDTSGNTKYRGIVNSSPKVFDKIVSDAFSRMPKWKPEIRNGVPVEASFTQTIYFYSGIEGEKTYDSFYRSDFEARVSDSNINNLQVIEITRYIFSSSNLGWINCDRFYRIESPKTDLFIKAGTYPNADVKIVFHSFKGILEGEKTSLGHVFKGIPPGEKITVLAIAKQKDKNFISLSESTTNSSINELVFEQVTMDVLKQKVARLNDLRK